MPTPVLCETQRICVAKLTEGVDFICYEQVPLGPLDLVYRDGRWIDRRTSDGEILAADRRNTI